MSSEVVPIHRTNASSSTDKKDETWFNAFNIAPGQDTNIRWLSRPNQQLVQQKYAHDAEKFRITFDAENFQPEQIKIYIQNGQLTVSGVYEERSEGRFMQKQFERKFDLPSNADVDSMASYITPNHMLVVEIPLSSTPQVDHLSLDNSQNNQRRLSFSLNKYNTNSANNQGLLSTSNDLAAPGNSVRRTSVTKTTTTTTSSGSSGIPAEAADLLRNLDTKTGSSQTYSSTTTERRSSNTGNQLSTSEPNSSSTTTKHTTLTASDLGDLPIDIPPELLASGGTITIQKRRVSINKSGDSSTPDHGVSVPSTQSSNTQSTKTTTTTTTSNESSNQSGSVPINRSNDTQSLSSTTTTSNTNQTGDVAINRNTNTLNQQQSNLTERRGSKSTTSSHSNSVFTLEEFLQNKTWNPSLVDGPNGKKILHMRLQMRPGTKADQIKSSLNGYDFRVEVDNKVTTDGGLQATEHSYRQVTLFPTCEIDHLTSELKDDGYLHIKVPINL